MCNKKAGRSKGFTLIEVMVTVAVLAFGIIAIYEALFVSVDAYGYYTRYFSTQDWIGEQIWTLQEELTDSGTLAAEQTAGSIVIDRKKFDWNMSIYELDTEQGLYRVNITLSWNEGSRTVHTSRDAYLLSPKLKAYHEEGVV